MSPKPFPRDKHGRFLPRKQDAVEEHAVVIVTLVKATGAVSYEEWFSTPMETAAALTDAAELAAMKLPHRIDFEPDD